MAPRSGSLNGGRASAERTSAAGVEPSIDGRLDWPVLHRALSDLRQGEQDILVLRYLEGVGTEEIAPLLGKTHVAVRVTLCRATKRLRRRLKVLTRGSAGDDR